MASTKQNLCLTSQSQYWTSAFSPSEKLSPAQRDVGGPSPGCGGSRPHSREGNLGARLSPVTLSDGDGPILLRQKSEKEGRKVCLPSKHTWNTHGEHVCGNVGSGKREGTEVGVGYSSQEDQSHLCLSRTSFEVGSLEQGECGEDWMVSLCGNDRHMAKAIPQGLAHSRH